MASGYSGSISGDRLGAKIRFYYSTTYHPSTNTSTVSVSPELYTTALTGGANGWGGNVYGNGSSIYSLSSHYYDGQLLIASNGQDTWLDFSPNSGSISSFDVAHNNSGYASFTLGYYGKVRAMYDGTTASFYSSDGISVTISEGRQLYVSYSANGGSGAPGATYFYGSTESIVLSSTRPTRTGYDFLGWSTSSTATTASYSAGQNIGTSTSSFALYAVWRKKSYSLTINADSGAIVHVMRGQTELVSGNTIYYGDSLTLSIQPKAGYQIDSRSPASNTVTVTNNLVITVITSPMATIHRRMNGAWATYLIYKRYNSAWELFQANIRKNGQWQKYF